MIDDFQNEALGFKSINEPLVLCDKHKKYIRCVRIGDIWQCPSCKKSWDDVELEGKNANRNPQSR